MSIVSQRVWKENGILSFIGLFFFCFLRTYTPNKIPNWSFFKLIFSDQALIISKQIFAYIYVF